MLIKNYSEIESLSKDLMDVQRFTFDTETTGLNWAQGAKPCGLSFRINDESYYIPIRHDKIWDSLDPEKVYGILKPVFNQEKTYILGHNIKFDAHMLMSDGINIKNIMIDTLLAAHFVNENEPMFKLEYLADKYLGKGSSIESQRLDEILKKNKLKKGEMWKLNPEIVAPYGCSDVTLTAGLWDKIYSPVLGKAGKRYQDLYLDICKYQTIIGKIERNGMTVDMDRLRLVKNEARETIDNIRRKLEGRSWPGFNPNSVPQVRKLLKIKDTNRASLTRIGTETTLMIMEYRKWLKALTTYYLPFEEDVELNGTNKIYPNFYMAGTVSGRLSCKDPNLQAIPRDSEETYKVKQILVAPKGYTLVSGDYSQAELRLLAHYTKEPLMLKIFNEGEDIHDETAKEMHVSRQVAKGINFGIVYGIGATELSRALNCSESEAADYLNLYHTKFPSVRKLYNYCQVMASERKYIKMWTGRQRHFNTPRAESWKAMSNLIQGGIAEVMRVAITKLDEYYDNERVKIINQIHDDIIFEVEDKFLEKELPMIKKIMMDFKFAVPMAVELKTGKRWSELKTIAV